MFKTAYLEIHERAHQELRAAGEPSWSDLEDIDERLRLLNACLHKNKVDWPSLRVLVLGCGDGEHALRIADLGAKVTGIDISPTAIDWAIEKASKTKSDAQFVVGSVLALPFENCSYDLVIDDHCFHCIIGDDREQFLREAYRVLKPSSYLFIRSMCGDMPLTTPPDLLKMFDPKSRCQVHNGIAGRYYGLADSILSEISGDFEPISSTITAQKEGGDMLNIFARKRSESS